MPAEKERQTSRRWTREEVLALPDDGNRYELVDGELLVSPSPRWPHQNAVLELAQLIPAYVKVHRLGRVGLSPSDLELRSGQVVQPDLFVAGMVGRRAPREWKEVSVPRLVIEVLSPDYENYDREVKRVLYKRLGVPTYWIVDVDARLVEVWTPRAKRPAIETARLTWRPNTDVPALEIDLKAFFAAVWEEA